MQPPSQPALAATSTANTASNYVARIVATSAATSAKTLAANIDSVYVETPAESIAAILRRPRAEKNWDQTFQQTKKTK